MDDQTPTDEMKPVATEVLPPPLPEVTPEPILESTLPPIVMTEQPKSGRRKLPWLVGGVLALLVAFGLTWAAVSELPVVGVFPLADELEALMLDAPWAAELDIYSVIPEDIEIVGWISVDREGEAWTKWNQLWNRFPRSDEWSEEVEKVFEADQTDADSLAWEQDFKPWIGDQVVIFGNVSELTLDPDATPMMGIAATTRNTREAERALIAMHGEEDVTAKADVDLSQYRGQEIMELDSDEFGVVMDHYAFFLSSRTMAEKIIDLHKDKGASLADNADFTRFQAETGTDLAGFGIIDMKSYVQSSLAEQLEGMPLEEDQLNDFLAIYDMMGFTGLTVRPEKDGLSLRESSALDWAVVEDKGFADSYNEWIPKLAERLPVETAFFAEINTEVSRDGQSGEAEPMILLPSELLQSLELVIPMVEAQLGLTIEEMRPLLAGQGGMAMWSHESTPVLAFMTEVEDEAEAKRVMDKLARIALAYASTGGFESTAEEREALFSVYFTERLVEGVVIESFDLPEVEGFWPDFANISFAVVDGFLILASDEAGILAFAGVEDGEALATAENYQQMRERQSEKVVGGMMYGDRANLFAWITDGVVRLGEVSGATAADLRPILGEIRQWEEDLAPLEGMSGWLERTEGGMDGTIFLSIPE